jgi:hypothetical protein
VRVLKGLGGIGIAVVVVIVVIVLAFGAIWLNGEFQRAQNNADTKGRTTNQAFIQAQQQKMLGFVNDWYTEGCDKQPQLGVCVNIVNQLELAASQIDAQYVPPTASALIAKYGRQ